MSFRVELAIVNTLVVLHPETSIHDAITQLLVQDIGQPWAGSANPTGCPAFLWQGAQHSHGVLVMEAVPGDRPSIGIATDRDLMAATVRSTAQNPITLRDVVVPARLTCYRSELHDLADLRAIGQQMQQQGITIVPVLDDHDHPVGLISVTSLLYALNFEVLTAGISQTGAPADEVREGTPIAPQEPPSLDQTRSLATIEAVDDPNPIAANLNAAPETIALWREHAACYRALFEDAHDAILIANLDGYITDVNYQAEALFGYSRHELIGLHQSQLHPPEDFDEISDKFQEVLRKQSNTTNHLRILCRNNIIKYVDIRGKIIMVGDRPIIQGIFHEVTQEKKIEESLRRVIIQTAEKQGEEFFASLVQAIACTLNVDCVFLVELIDETLTPLAIYPPGISNFNQPYNFKNTPCEYVLKQGRFSCESGIQEQFPNDPHLVEMEAEGYVGITLRDQTGTPIGNLSIIHRKALKNTQYILSILGIFAVRATAELERQRANQKLKQLNQTLQNTLLKRTHQLREQEHFLQTLLDLDAFPLSVFWKDVNSVYLGCNQSFLRDANLQSLDDIIGQDDYAMPWGATEAEAYRADDREVITSNQPKLGIIETQIRGDGRQTWIETNKIPFHDLNGHVMGVLGVYQDITDRKHSEYELQRISTRLNLAVQSAKIGIWEWDIRTDVLLWDEQMFILYGVEQILSEINYDFWLNCLHSDDIERSCLAIKQALAGQADYNTELRIVRPDGEIRFLQANAIVQHDEQGQPIGMVGVNYDITDQKCTEQRLRQQLETIEAAAEGIAIFQDDRYVLINQAHVKLFGYDEVEELIGKSWKILYEPEEQARFEDDILPALMRDRVWQGEAIGRRKDGSTFAEGLSLTLSKDGALICICRDISASKQAEQQLRDAKEAAELADRAKSNFLALMSHEIRTPINGVLGLAHLLQHTPLEAQQRDYLTQLNQSAQSLSQIVNDILDFSKIEADKLSLETIPFQLDEVLERLEAVLALKASEKHLDFRVETGATVPRCLVGDPLRLGQVAINLVSNAIKFTDRGCVMIQIEECDRTETTTRLRFAVSDTGIGLSPAQITTLFEPFTQVDPSTSRRQGGTGLGLSICQRLVQLMGGTIEVHSELGQGSTFTFELTFECDASQTAELNVPDGLVNVPEFAYSTAPISLSPSPMQPYDPHWLRDSLTIAAPVTPSDRPPTTAKSTSTSAAIRPSSPAILQGASVLLVEDNDVNQLVARKILEQFGMRVDLAVNGRKAIAQALNHHYDLILMDVRMPEMDGLEATRRIRRLSELGNGAMEYLKSVPIIAMTAHAFKSDQRRSLEAGMNDHLCKPINPDILGQILADWLERSQGGTRQVPVRSEETVSVDTITKPIAPPIAAVAPTSPALIVPEIPPMYPDLDVIEGLARVYNDTQLYCELLNLFAEIYEPFAATLHTAFQRGDRDEIIHLLHTLKGAAANVSAIMVVTQSTQILQRLRTPSDQFLGLQFDSDEIVALLRSLDLTLAHITQVLGKLTV